jgi:hypothetical protein
MTTYDHAHERSFFLSEQQRELLAAVIDRIIPPSDSVPSTAEVGVTEHVEGISGIFPPSRSVLANGLKAVEATSSSNYSKRFVALSDGEKSSVLRDVEPRHKQFFDTLVRETYSGYYSHPTVLRAKGLPLSAPQPIGYEVEPFDMSLLEPVRNRGKAYRDA